MKKLLPVLAAAFAMLATAGTAAILECKEIGEGGSVYVDIQAASISLYYELEDVNGEKKPFSFYQNVNTENFSGYLDHVEFGEREKENIKGKEFIAKGSFSETEEYYVGTLSYSFVEENLVTQRAGTFVVNRKTGEAVERYTDTFIESIGIHSEDSTYELRCTLSEANTNNLF